MHHPPPRPSFWSPLTREQKQEALRELFLAPALSLAVFARTRVGLRLLTPLRILRVCAMLFLTVHYLLPLLGGTRRDASVLTGFALAFLAAAVYQYACGWRAMNSGDPRHTHSTGLSRIETSVRFPAWLKRHRRVYRFGEPLVCFAIAACAFALSPALGAWLILATSCLMVFEEHIYRAALAQDLDVGDSLFEGEIQKETVAHYTGRRKSKGHSATASGLPTGIGPDIDERIAKRLARKRASRP